jgi:serine/threonine protein kinase
MIREGSEQPMRASHLQGNSMLGAHPGHRRYWGHRKILMGARDKKQLFFPGQWVLDCRVIRLLGRGGIAEVYEVLHKGERFALKIIQSAWIDDEVQAARMVLEGELLSMIRHPHVVDVQEAGVFEHAGKKLVWLRMELLHGRTLREEMCQREELLSVPLICAYLWQSALGAHQCHVLGAVHRDIKPENLFVTPGPVIKLLDFGLAKLLHGGFETGEGQRLGTPLYMSPEQIRGQSVTPAADVYALAVVGWELFAGINPFVDDPRAYDLRVLYHRHFSVVPPPLTNIGVPLPIADVIARGLEKSPAFDHKMALPSPGKLKRRSNGRSTKTPASPRTGRATHRRRRWRLSAKMGCALARGLPTKGSRRP